MFRQPIGNYQVGIMQFDTTMISTGKFARRLPITVFYPSDEKKGMMPYIHGGYIRQQRKGKNVKGDVDTYCYKDVALSTKKNSYPVIVYSHGLEGYRMDNTVLCADLASQGYIIFSVGHPYGANIVQYTDGTYFDDWKSVIGQDTNCPKLKLLSMFFKIISPFRSLNNKEHVWDWYCENYATVQQQLLPLWEEDLVVGMDTVEKVAKGEIATMFEDHLNLSNGMILMGMSLGGNAVVNTGLKDRRAKKVINIDGGLWSKLNEIYNQPSILVYCQRINIFSHLRLRAMGYPKLTIKKQSGIKHWEYADGVYLGEKGKKNTEWAFHTSREKAKACMEFISK